MPRPLAATFLLIAGLALPAQAGQLKPCMPSQAQTEPAVKVVLNGFAFKMPKAVKAENVTKMDRLASMRWNSQPPCVSGAIARRSAKEAANPLFKAEFNVFFENDCGLLHGKGMEEHWSVVRLARRKLSEAALDGELMVCRNSERSGHFNIFEGYAVFKGRDPRWLYTIRLRFDDVSGRNRMESLLDKYAASIDEDYKGRDIPPPANRLEPQER